MDYMSIQQSTMQLIIINYYYSMSNARMSNYRVDELTLNSDTVYTV